MLRVSVVIALCQVVLNAEEKKMHDFDSVTSASIALGQYGGKVSLNPERMDEALKSMPVGGESGRYTIGGQSISTAKYAIAKINKGDMNLTEDEKRAFLICVAAMLKIEANRNSEIMSARVSENPNVYFDDKNDIFIGYSRDNIFLGELSFNDLKAAYEKFKLALSGKATPTAPSDFSASIALGQYGGKVSLNPERMDEALKSMPVGGESGRYTIGGQSISTAKYAIAKINKGDMNLTEDEKRAFLICVAAMLKIEANRNSEITSARVSENPNVDFDDNNDTFIGYRRDGNFLAELSFNDLKAAYEKFKLALSGKAVGSPAEVDVIAPAENDAASAANVVEPADDQVAVADGMPEAIENRTIPSAIRELVEKGRESFRTGDMKSKFENYVKIKPDTGAFRYKSWVQETFGMFEYLVVDFIKEKMDEGILKAPKPTNIGALRAYFKNFAESERRKVSEKPKITVVEGVGVSGIHRSEYGKNAVIQLASQANYLESMSDNITMPGRYPNDPTQGPLGVIEAAAATFHRHAAVITEKLPHAMHNILPDNYPYYRNGYFTPGRDENKEALAKLIHDNIDKLETLAQRVIHEDNGVEGIHVMNFAPSYQSDQIPTRAEEIQICTDLVAAQYEATAMIAVLESIKTGKSVNLHLTCVGQGAFKNPKSVMNEAFKRVAKVVNGFNVNVFVHLYMPDSYFENSALAPVFNMSKINNGQFFKPVAETSKIDPTEDDEYIDIR
ncbi:MAG: hypothetical protein NEHIOOID_00388 [Holosporales bacterium]